MVCEKIVRKIDEQNERKFSFLCEFSTIRKAREMFLLVKSFSNPWKLCYAVIRIILQRKASPKVFIVA